MLSRLPLLRKTVFKKIIVTSGKCTTYSISKLARTMCSMSDQSPPKFLSRGNGSSLAYRAMEGSSPGLLFLPGFMSNMNGGKALALEKYCQENGLSYVRFDYQGCGESIGEIPSSSAFGVWKSDAVAVLDELTKGPQYVVGSSMGGGIMLMLAMERPDRVQGLVGVATAAKFVGHLTYTDTIQKEDGQTETHTTSVPAEKFIEKSEQSQLLGDSLPITCPVRLLHGMKDDTVPYERSLDVARRLQSKDVDVILRKEGDHRLSTPFDLQLLIETLDKLMKQKAKL
ncbi:palmitoyl-protein thioesterase ABHD10, mitochondrial-like [Glandiceps talaboti]